MWGIVVQSISGMINGYRMNKEGKLGQLDLKIALYRKLKISCTSVEQDGMKDL